MSGPRSKAGYLAFPPASHLREWRYRKIVLPPLNVTLPDEIAELQDRDAVAALRALQELILAKDDVRWEDRGAGWDERHWLRSCHTRFIARSNQGNTVSSWHGAICSRTQPRPAAHG